MKTTRNFLLILLAIFSLTNKSCFGQWSTNSATNNLLNNNYVDRNCITTDGNGGLIIVFMATNGLSVKRINSCGIIQWTTIINNSINPVTTQQAYGEVPVITSDGSGGAVIAWVDTRVETNGSGDRNVYAQRVNASGVAQWTTNGVAICTQVDTQLYTAIVSDGSGGAIITWEDYRNGTTNIDIYARRINSSGVAQGGNNGGVAICTAANNQEKPTIISDGSGGAIIAWRDYRNETNGDIYARRFNSSNLAQWTANGVAICTAVNNQETPTLTTDGSGGAIITWSDLRGGALGTVGNTGYKIYVQRVNSSGVVQWILDGIQIVSAFGDMQLPVINSDGSGGAIISWQDWRANASAVFVIDIYAQRINSAGAVQWTTDGAPICTATSNQSSPNIVTSSNGNSIITWEDKRNGLKDIYAQSIDANGIPLWTLNGVAVCTAANDQTLPDVITDGNQGAIIAWRDYRNGTFPWYNAQRINASGILTSNPASIGAISGPTAICTGSSNTYSVPNVTGITYNWAKPTGWTGASTTNSLTTTSNSTIGNVTLGVSVTNTCGTTNSNLTITVSSATPATPGTISGTNLLCSGTTNSYSVSAVTGATSYTWTLPNGWTGTSTTNSISAVAGSNSGNITVTANNGCGSSVAQTKAITVNNIPATPGPISGPSSICLGSSGNIYSVPSAGAISYTWTKPIGWTGTSTSNTINTAIIGFNGVSGNITVTASNQCGTSSPAILAVTVHSSLPVSPGSIAGPNSICSGSSNSYSVPPMNVNTAFYTWTLPNGWTGTSATNSIPTTANGNGGNITVVANNGCGSSSAQTLSVAVNTTPAMPSSISGTNSICVGSSNTFNILSVSGASSYTWTLPNGWTGNSTTNSITTTANGTGGEITVTANNSCGSSTPQTLSVTTNPSPIINTQPTNTQVSIGNQAIFTTSANGGTYQWQVNSGSGFQNVTNGGQFSGATTNTLTVSNTSMSNNTNQYQCIVTSNNCSATSNAATLTVINNVGLSDVDQLNNLEIYPNPTSNFVTVRFNNNLLGSKYQIVDNTGRIVLSGLLLDENQIIELNTLSAGIYSFRVIGELSKTIKLSKN